jgi:hypothetical protein
MCIGSFSVLKANFWLPFYATRIRLPTTASTTLTISDQPFIHFDVIQLKWCRQIINEWEKVQNNRYLIKNKSFWSTFLNTLGNTETLC